MPTNVADYIYYRLVYDYLSDEISTFGMTLMKNMMSWASGIALVLVTLWIMFQGFRILTGQSREPLMATVLNMGRIAVIVGAATTMAFAGSDLHTYLTKNLDKEINGVFTGKDDKTTSSSIDENLAYTQLALSTINGVKVVQGDDEMQSAKDRSLYIATFGTASPPMAAGAMLLLYQFAMALFIGLGPLFILCLIFDQTKSLFQRWLMYGIGTIFSMALLSAVAAMVLELTVRVSIAFWVNRGLNTLMGNQPEGLTSVAMQQGGIGLLLSILIVSVPPMAAMFFQGTLGSALTYSVFQGAGGRPGPQGQPPGSGTTYAPQMTSNQPHAEGSSSGSFSRTSAPIQPIQQDATKPSSQVRPAQ
ncbi:MULTISPECIES: type IV secretion system protein [Rhodanobacteraceae]|uniref:type IV secretion system protein n=1 Tax=Rhodanobacteraceae TaxID=1775411 RepID=UPI00088077F3|nr:MULTISPECIES: type IV secretion system protein [Rhodanobacteraceae]SDH03375.1 type IV secretion system protein VirB6 [Dyella sp. 333MFSha]SKC05708.1 type IV secretion system protein VirB6 [Luteibacter sp. 22Crub2.1]